DPLRFQPVVCRLLQQHFLEGGAPRRRDRIGLADRPTGLLDRRDGGEPFLAQPGERWVDRAIAGAEEMAERPFLEELLDLVPGRVAAAQCSEAGGPHIHAATPYIDSIYR